MSDASLYAVVVRRCFWIVLCGALVVYIIVFVYAAATVNYLHVSYADVGAVPLLETIVSEGIAIVWLYFL